MAKHGLKIPKKDRPWDDKRGWVTNKPVVRPITAQELIEAVKQMKEIPVLDHYYFCTDWVKPYVSEEDCIKFFADNGAVLVIDSRGRKWCRGKPVELYE